MQIALGRGVAFGVVASAVTVLQRSEVAGSVGPAFAGVLRRLSHSGPLVEKGADGLSEDPTVDFVADLEARRAQTTARIEDVVTAGRLHRRKIEPPNAVAAGGVGSSVLPRTRRLAEHDATGGVVDELIERSRTKRRSFGCVKALTRRPDHCDLGAAWQVAKLVDHQIWTHLGVCGGCAVADAAKGDEGQKDLRAFHGCSQPPNVARAATDSANQKFHNTQAATKSKTPMMTMPCGLVAWCTKG